MTLCWRGGMLTEIDVNLPRSRPASIGTDAGNEQDRATARGLRFTTNTNHIGNRIRRHWNIPCLEPALQVNSCIQISALCVYISLSG